MLETIRQYAAARLNDSARQRARTAHRDWYLHLVEVGRPELRSGGAPEWPPHLDAEYENFRAALAWSEERGENEAFARLVAALWWYWQMRGLINEPTTFFSGPSRSTRLRRWSAPAPERRGLFAYDRGEYARAEDLATEARACATAATRGAPRSPSRASASSRTSGGSTTELKRCSTRG